MLRSHIYETITAVDPITKVESALPGATVTLTTAQTLFADASSGTQLANPLVADSRGVIEAWTALPERIPFSAAHNGFSTVNGTLDSSQSDRDDAQLSGATFTGDVVFTTTPWRDARAYATLQAAIDAASAAGGGIVSLGPGVTDVTSITLKSNVLLRGSGRSTIIRNISAAQSIVSVPSTTSVFGIADLTIQGGTSGDFWQPLNIDGATDGYINNVRIVGGTHYGVSLQNNAARIQVSNLSISGQRLNPFSGTGGVGLWLFRGTTDCEFSNLHIEDTEGQGILLDGGTSTGVHTVVARNKFSSVAIRNCGRLSNGTLQLEGAQDNTFSSFSIDGPVSGTANGIDLVPDQTPTSGDLTPIPVTNNVFVGGVLRNIRSVPIRVWGGSRNLFSGIDIHNVNTSSGGSNEAVALLDDSQYDCTDNEFIGVKVRQDNAVGSYGYGVVASQDDGGRVIQRNRFVGCEWGNPGTARYVALGTVPVYGVDANILDDGATLIKAGAPVDGDFVRPVDGLRVLDSTNHRLYIRDGASWRFAALT